LNAIASADARRRIRTFVDFQGEMSAPSAISEARALSGMSKGDVARDAFLRSDSMAKLQQNFFRSVICLSLAAATSCAPEPQWQSSLRTAAVKRDATISAGDVTLAATLYRPPGVEGDVSAVVLSHGSGPLTRDMNGYFIDLALEAGLAVLAYDKRGAGQSTGTDAEWEVDDTPRIVADLASDMVHATRWLSTQPGIRKDQIGLLGGSQAGWVMPLAASKSPQVKFIVVISGVPLPTGAEEVHSKALADLGQDDERAASLKEILAADAVTLRSRSYKGFDPGPVLENLGIPTFWMFGLHDGVIPARQSIARIEQLRSQGRLNHEMHVFKEGNHDLRNVSTGKLYNVAQVIRGWLDQKGISGRYLNPELFGSLPAE
jgi:pimeloyl-ACP methyl ester carboxylesterase